MISSTGYIMVVGESWRVVDAWRRDYPDQPFVGVRVDGAGVWIAVEPRIAAGPLQAGVIAKIESALEATGRDTWADDKVILCEARSVREGHRLARLVVGILRASRPWPKMSSRANSRREEMSSGVPNDAIEVVSLWGACGEFSLPGVLWLSLLKLAQLYGWTQTGTEPPAPSVGDLGVEFECLGRDGSYFPPNCQIMTREDARHFAEALERVLLDIPETAVSSEPLVFAGWDRASSAPSPSIMQRLGTVKPVIRDLIAHCRECGELWIC